MKMYINSKLKINIFIIVKYLIICLLFIANFLLFSCKEKKLTFEKIKDIKIKIPDDIETTPHGLNYLKINNKQYIHYQASGINGIDIYSLDDFQFFKKIKLEVPFVLTGYYIKDFDNIYFLYGQDNLLLHTDTSLTIKDTFNLKNINKKEFYYYGYYPTPIIMKDNILYSMANNIESMVECIKSPRVLKYDLKKRIVEFLVSSPDSYLKIGNPGSLAISFCINENNDIVTLFNLEDSIYVFNKNNKIKNKFSINSDFIDSLSFFDIRNMRNEFITKPQHNSIQYDKDRNIYIVLSIHKQNLKTDGLLNNMNSHSWSITFFDKTFKKLDEVFFESKKYYFQSFFVNRNGIFIQRQNHLEKDKEFLIFDKFDLKYE